MKLFTNIFDDTISLENLFIAFDEFKRDKRNKKDVMAFEWNLEANIIKLHTELKYHNYRHGVYTKFIITDPKPRHIHKATVRDRVLHHAIFRIFNPIFEPSFIPNSFSCQIGKGTHKGITSLRNRLRKVSQNGTVPCFALKCDISKFFASVNHSILLGIIGRRIKDGNAIWLINEIIESFPLAEPNREREREREYGPSAQTTEFIR